MHKKYWEWEPVFNIKANDSALLVIDMQNAFVEESSALHVPMASEQLPTFNKLIEFCRTENIPIIYTKFCVGPDRYYDFYWKIAQQRGLKVEEPVCELWEGKYETEIIEDIAPKQGDIVINKYGYDCFAETDLEENLRKFGINNLLVTGTVLNWCIDSTVRSAFHKHYNVTVISDAVSSYDHAGITGEKWCEIELNLFAEAFARVVSSEDLVKEIEKNKVSGGI